MRTMYFVAVVLLAVLVLCPPGANSQHNVRVPPFGGSNYLNDFVMGDTVGNGARRDSSAVYVLTRGANYLSNAIIRNTGWTLRISANDTVGTVGRPVVYLYPNATTQLPPGQFVDMRGDAIIKNIIMSGYFEPIPGNLTGLQGALFNMTASGKSLTLDSCVLTNTNGNHIRTDSAPKNLKITNCIFANMGYLGRSNLGAGKGIDVRAGSVDSFIVVNNTFVNWQDRIIRHFGSTANIQYLRFEHNTCVNGMSYHGFLSLGRLGRRAIISNNLLVDPFAAGQDTDAVRQAEFTDSGEKDAFGFPRMTWIFSAPNDTTFWSVKHNYFRISAAGQLFFDSASVLPIVANPALVAGTPLSYNINSRIGSDSTTAFLPHTATLPVVPNLLTALMKWYRRPFVSVPDSGANKTKLTSMWFPKYDYDRRIIKYYTDSLNCAYSTSNAVYTAATGGYPVGDLNWFPTRYTAWLGDPVSTGVPTEQGQPVAFALEQNYPNPFNPSTTIKFVIGKSAYTTLTVYNILGQRVATPVAGMLEAGPHEVRLNASALASGMYFYQLASGSSVAVKKMMVLK
jgi:hypothetical protein